MIDPHSLPSKERLRAAPFICGKLMAVIHGDACEYSLLLKSLTDLTTHTKISHTHIVPGLVLLAFGPRFVFLP